MLAATAAPFMLLAACGGGGGGDGGATSLPTAPVAPVTPVAPTPASITITTAPASQSASDGRSARLHVAATSSAPLSCQWQRDGITIVGANDAAYVTPVLALTDSGARYAVLVSNAGAADLTTIATVTVLPLAPRLTEQPMSLTVAAGQPAPATAPWCTTWAARSPAKPRRSQGRPVLQHRCPRHWKSG